LKTKRKTHLKYLCYLESTGGPYCCIDRKNTDKWKGIKPRIGMPSDYDNLISSVSNDLFPYHTHAIIGSFRIFNAETGNLLLFSGDDGSLALMEMVHNENWSIPWDGICLDISARALNLGEELYDGIAIFDSTINLEDIYLGSFRACWEILFGLSKWSSAYL
jgi:hypothetical protein